MTPHYADELVTLHHGDCLDVLRSDELGYDYRLGYAPPLIPDDSIDAIVTDPPYGLAELPQRVITDALTAWLAGDRSHVPDGKGFMGREWDKFVPPPALWDEARRVLKPGGHLLAFAGSRTQDLMGVSIRLAGFELRDSIAWLYGSGFPKNLDLSEAMARHLAGDRIPDNVRAVIRPGMYEVTAFLRAARDAAGWNNKRIDALFGTNGMAGHWTSTGTQPAVPSLRQWAILKDALGFDDSMDGLVEELAATERPEDWGATAAEYGPFLDALRRDPDATGPGGDWGTALKPGYEPIVVARKPFPGTTTANVIKYGTGALNIGGCRVETDEDRRRNARGGDNGLNGEGAFKIRERRAEDMPDTSGRWPTNVALDESQAAELDQQSGDRPGMARGQLNRGATTGRSIGGASAYGSAAPQTVIAGYDDAGGASRFFLVVPRDPGHLPIDELGPRFRYAPKPHQGERVRINGVAHPTVKPLSYVRWLARLVTPPGGTLLEPFAGSGPTVEACVLEGFRCIAIEREAEYLPLITQRIHRRLDPVAAIKATGDDAGLFDLLATEGGSS